LVLSRPIPGPPNKTRIEFTYKRLHCFIVLVVDDISPTTRLHARADLSLHSCFTFSIVFTQIVQAVLHGFSKREFFDLIVRATRCQPNYQKYVYFIHSYGATAMALKRLLRLLKDADSQFKSGTSSGKAIKQAVKQSSSQCWCATQQQTGN